MWNINVNVTYYDYANIICELVVIRDCNNDAVLNKEECNVVSCVELLFNMHVFVDLESE